MVHVNNEDPTVLELDVFSGNDDQAGEPSLEPVLDLEIDINLGPAPTNVDQAEENKSKDQYDDLSLDSAPKDPQDEPALDSPPADANDGEMVKQPENHSDDDHAVAKKCDDNDNSKDCEESKNDDMLEVE